MDKSDNNLDTTTSAAPSPEAESRAGFTEVVKQTLRARLHKNRPAPCERKRLGLLRVWEFVFFAIVAANVIALFFESQYSVHFTFDTWLNLADALCAGVVVWLISKRKRVTRMVVCIYAPTMLEVGVVADLILNQLSFSWVYFLHHGRALFLLALLYFLFSKKVRVLLDQPFAVHEGATEAIRESDLYRVRDAGFWRNMVMYFMIFSVVGHWMELFYAMVVRNTGGPYDPTAPMLHNYLEPFSIYGFGAVACILLLFPLKQLLSKRIKNILLVLLIVYSANVFICTTIELVGGLALNHPGPDGKLIYWDYTDRPLNFMGQICPENSLAFGAVATLMVWVIFPAVEGFLLTRTDDEVDVAFVIILVAYLLLVAFYLIVLPTPQDVPIFLAERPG
jgi:uncharacterized membrane protein